MHQKVRSKNAGTKTMGPEHRIATKGCRKTKTGEKLHTVIVENVTQVKMKMVEYKKSISQKRQIFGCIEKTRFMTGVVDLKRGKPEGSNQPAG